MTSATSLTRRFRVGGANAGSASRSSIASVSSVGMN